MKPPIIIKIGKDKYKILPSEKYYIDTRTPVGEPADFYWIKPYGGKKMVEPLAFLSEKGVEFYKYKVYDEVLKEWVVKAPESLLKFIESVT